MIKLNYIFMLFFSIFLLSCSNNELNSNINKISLNQQKEVIIDSNTPKIYYLGLGLWGNGETWSENDVIDLESVFREIYHNREFKSYIFSNKGTETKPSIPFFSEKKIRIVIKKINHSVRENDLIIIAISSHGFPGGINYRVGVMPSMTLTGSKIQEIFEPIKQNNVLFIISSCYSGSLIQNLRGKNSIVFTAASANNPSFGCDKDSENSWFIESLKESYYSDQFILKRFSLKKWFNETKNIVKNKEESYGYTYSSPQIFIGKNVNPFVFLL